VTSHSTLARPDCAQSGLCWPAGSDCAARIQSNLFLPLEPFFTEAGTVLTVWVGPQAAIALAKVARARHIPVVVDMEKARNSMT